MINVDGGNDRVGIGLVPNAMLEVGGEIRISDPSADSHVYLRGASGQKAKVTLNEFGVRSWEIGAGTKASGVFTIDNNGTEVLRIDGNNAMTKPLQPAFQARPTSQQSNLPINANTTIIFGTEIFDQNGDFASNTFTAPVTGKYQLSVSLYVLNADIDVNYFSSILETSNRAYSNVITTESYDADLSYTSITQSALVDMDANDTAYVYVNLPNQGAAQADIHTNSYFSGFLVC